jgi:hypothetical protein
LARSALKIFSKNKVEVLGPSPQTPEMSTLRPARGAAFGRDKKVRGAGAMAPAFTFILE